MTSDDETVKDQVPLDQDPPQDRDPANNGDDPANPAFRPPTTLPGRVFTPPPSTSRQNTPRTEQDSLVLERRRLTAERLRIQAEVSEMLVTLNANPLGSSDILRDRLLRALKRNIDPETVWTLEDQPITQFSDEITDKGVQNSFISPLRYGAAATTTMTTTTTITTMATGLLTVNTTPTSTGRYLPMES
ncbi:hypothetical protein KQX54_013997 [Cotesia glomerata]|uniref:Uncharacterized protein n=1 Tax=Cotesia glomerata TaxID=32391 RepID=A0AAV7IDG4_COTGL|nr:hypothetical protein KQX54_013997 [Cotesia glomerata]